MTVFKHYCLDGEHRPGQELDCPVCRVLLLEAFRGPADVPALPQPPAALPHLILENSGRTVEIPHQDTLADLGPVVHETQHGTSSAEGEPGGIWWATCTCGWEAHGRYPVTRVLAALRHAATAAADHEKEHDQ